MLIAPSWWAAAQLTVSNSLNLALTKRGFSSPGPGPGFDCVCSPEVCWRGCLSFPPLHIYTQQKMESDNNSEHITITHSTEGSEALRKRRLPNAVREHGGLLSASAFRAAYLCKLQKNTFGQGHKKVHPPNPHCNPSAGKPPFHIDFKIYSLNNPLQSPPF